VRPLASVGSRLALLLIATALLAGSVTLEPERIPAFSTRDIAIATRDRVLPFRVPAPLTDARMDIHEPPIAVPIELLFPTLQQRAPVIGVGMTPQNVMDAPKGPADSPVWQQAFWYRGSATPGSASSALIAGHVSDPLGRPGIFANLGLLRPGDTVVVHDIRTGLDVVFAVMDATSYPIERTADPAVLTAIYGAGPVAGKWAQPSADGRSYLTLVTCDGTFRDGTHDHRLVVHAVRIS
jgi:hypothetical protein